jgi:outer membrane murein-binding lipoprotein Lpp
MEEVYGLENLVKEKELELSDKNLAITEKNHKIEKLSSKYNELEKHATKIDFDLGEKIVYAENQIVSLNKIIEMKNSEMLELENRVKEEDTYKKVAKQFEENNLMLSTEIQNLKSQKDRLEKDAEGDREIYMEITKLRSEMQEKNIEINT